MDAINAIDAIHLIDKFRTREARVAIIGLGYVGLPLAVAFAEAGFRVVGIDMNEERVANLNAGQSYIADIPSERLAAVVTRSRLKSERANDPSPTDAIDAIDAPTQRTQQTRNATDAKDVINATQRSQQPHLSEGFGKVWRLARILPQGGFEFFLAFP